MITLLISRMFQRCRFHFFLDSKTFEHEAEAYWSQPKIFASRYQGRSSL